MATEISKAIGTQKQFRKMPEGLYQEQLNTPTFGRNIAEGQNLDAQTFAKSLGILGDAIFTEDVHEDRRKRNQFTYEEIQRLTAGKTTEDLSKLDKMLAVQHSDLGYDLTDNPYFMAGLEKSMGEMASYNAKQEYLKENDGNVPKSIGDALAAFHVKADEAYKTVKGNISNEAAFNNGFYSAYYNDTLQIADHARKAIDEDRRNTGVRYCTKRFDDLINGMKDMSPDAFSNTFNGITQELQRYTHTPTESAKIIAVVLDEISGSIDSTDKLNKLKDIKFFDQHKIGDEISFSKYYSKVAKNVNLTLAEKIKAQARRADGTIDFDKAGKLLDEEIANAKKGAKGTNLPSVPMSLNSDDVGRQVGLLSPEFQGAMPFIGGMLYNLGIERAIVTSGGRSEGENAAISNSGSGSYHVQNNAIDIDIGHLSREEGNALAAKFAPYFEEPKWEMDGDSDSTGDHLHLGGYKGGLSGSKDVDSLATSYNPNMREEIIRKLKSADADARQEKERVQKEAYGDLLMKLRDVKSYDERYSLINNSNLDNITKAHLLGQVDAQVEREAKVAAREAETNTIDVTARHFNNYYKNAYTKDLLFLQYCNNKWENGEELSDAEGKKYDSVNRNLDAFWAYSNPDYHSKYGYKYSGDTGEGNNAFPDNTPADFKKEEDKNFTNNLMQQTVDQLKANGMTKDDILAELQEYADEQGITLDDVLKQVNLD